MTNGGLQEGRARDRRRGLGRRASAGLGGELIDDLFVGVSYQSQPGFKADPEGRRRHHPRRRPDTRDDAHQGRGHAGDAGRRALRRALRQAEVLEARAFADFARWSVLKEQCVLNATIDGRSCEGDAPPGKIIIIPRLHGRTPGAYAPAAAGGRPRTLSWCSGSAGRHLDPRRDGRAGVLRRREVRRDARCEGHPRLARVDAAVHAVLLPRPGHRRARPRADRPRQPRRPDPQRHRADRAARSGARAGCRRPLRALDSASSSSARAIGSKEDPCEPSV